jgi:hypothetical protein
MNWFVIIGFLWLVSCSPGDAAVYPPGVKPPQVVVSEPTPSPRPIEPETKGLMIHRKRIVGNHAGWEYDGPRATQTR